MTRESRTITRTWPSWSRQPYVAMAMPTACSSAELLVEGPRAVTQAEGGSRQTAPAPPGPGLGLAEPSVNTTIAPGGNLESSRRVRAARDRFLACRRTSLSAPVCVRSASAERCWVSEARVYSEIVLLAEGSGGASEHHLLTTQTAKLKCRWKRAENFVALPRRRLSGKDSGRSEALRAARACFLALATAGQRKYRWGVESSWLPQR